MTYQDVFAQVKWPVTEPCYPDYHQGTCSTDYEGPKYITICSDRFELETVNCSPPCCITFQYYDRFINCGSQHFYDVQLHHAQPDSYGCWNCFETNKEKFINEFYYQMFANNWTKFRYWILLGQKCFDNNHRVTKGACFNVSGNPPEYTPCTDTSCCVTNIRVCFTSTGEITKMEPHSNTLLNNAFDCNGYPENTCQNAVMQCDVTMQNPAKCVGIPCDDRWTFNLPAFSGWIPFPNCPGCEVNIYYNYRQTEGCLTVYNDYTIDKVEYRNCDGCPGFTETELYKFTINWLLRNGYHGFPDEENECFTNYRIINSPCFVFDNTRHYFTADCDKERCCWKVYELCYPNTIRVIDQSVDMNIDCANFAMPCVFICDIEP